jgi:hypothetical protein
MGFISSRCPVVSLFAVLLSALLVSAVGAQGIQTSPYSAPSMLRGLSGQGLDLAPANRLGLPGSFSPDARSSESLPISSGMFQGLFPPVPNLDFGFNWIFGRGISTGNVTADYIYPIRFAGQGRLFWQGHANYTAFSKEGGSVSTSETATTVPSPTFFTDTDTIVSRASLSSPNRWDLSLGGGYRRLVGNKAFVGVNAFLDNSTVSRKWYSSWGWGLEWACLTPGNGLIDLHLNQYGNLFNNLSFKNAFRNVGTSYDIEAGYAVPLFNDAVDLRLKGSGYQFNVGEHIYGYRTGADLTTRDGVFSVSYDYSYDRLHGDYHTVGGWINVAMQPENILRGENPFSLPAPVFASPRNLNRPLNQKVKRNWQQPTSVLMAQEASRSSTSTRSRLILTRTRGASVYVVFDSVVPRFLLPLPGGITQAQISSASLVRVRAIVNNNGFGSANINVGLGRTVFGPSLFGTVHGEPFNAGTELVADFTSAQIQSLPFPAFGINAVGIQFASAGSSGGPVARNTQTLNLTITVEVYE